jgi:RNA polymerase sigma factor (sigma-70 family)
VRRGRTTARGGGDLSRRAWFEELYNAHVDAVLAYAYRRVDLRADAADILAETMLVAWRRSDEVPPGHEARFWLLAVARRVLANHKRGANRRLLLGERLRQNLQRLAESDHATAVTTRVVVGAAMDRLGESDREILQLAAWERLSAEEIAAVLGINATAARSRLHRARARLRRHLEGANGATTASLQRETTRRHWSHDDDVLVSNPEDDR